jgi:hypothetical protein
VAFGCSPPASLVGVLHDTLPSSHTHAPNSTWWGHQQGKVARHGDTVYVGIIENDVGDGRSAADYNLYEVSDLGVFLRGSHPSSRPGNVLVDAEGTIHVLSFEPVDPTINDSVGSLIHTAYVEAPAGNFENPSRTVVRAASNPYVETVNIRVGATVSEAGEVSVAYGLNAMEGYAGKVMVLQTRDITGVWRESVLDDVGHEYYYPFVAHTSSRRIVLPVQDDYVAGNPPFNRYYQIPLFAHDGAGWSSEMLIDVSNDPLAVDDARTQLVEQSELFERSDGTVVAVYKDKRAGTTFVSREITAEGVVGPPVTLEWASGAGLEWVRAFEIHGDLYFWGSSWGQAHVVRAVDASVVPLVLPDWPKGAYPYLSSHRGGAVRNASDWLDVLAVSGDSEQYPSPGMELYRIPKTSIVQMFTSR